MSAQINPGMEDKLFMHPYFINTCNAKYLVEPYGDIDFVQYRLHHQGRYICTISMNEDGEWEVEKEIFPLISEKIPTIQSAVRIIGKAIEDKISETIIQGTFSHKLWS